MAYDQQLAEAYAEAERLRGLLRRACDHAEELYESEFGYGRAAREMPPYILELQRLRREGGLTTESEAEDGKD